MLFAAARSTFLRLLYCIRVYIAYTHYLATGNESGDWLLGDKMASEEMDCASSPMAVLKSEPPDPGVSDTADPFKLQYWCFALE